MGGHNSAKITDVEGKEGDERKEAEQMNKFSENVYDILTKTPDSKKRIQPKKPDYVPKDLVIPQRNNNTAIRSLTGSGKRKRKSMKRKGKKKRQTRKRKGKKKKRSVKK